MGPECSGPRGKTVRKILTSTEQKEKKSRPGSKVAMKNPTLAAQNITALGSSVAGMSARLFGEAQLGEPSEGRLMNVPSVTITVRVGYKDHFFGTPLKLAGKLTSQNPGGLQTGCGTKKRMSRSTTGKVAEIAFLERERILGLSSSIRMEGGTRGTWI